MPATTPSGLPYPLPGEPVRDGAVAIRNLAEKLDPRAKIVTRGGRLDILSNAATGLFKIQFSDIVWQSCLVQCIVPQDAYLTYSGNSEGPGSDQASAIYFTGRFYSGAAMAPGAGIAIHYIATGTIYP
jgi:hypothetical protein